MKILISSAAAILACLIAVPATAQDRLYVGAGYTFFDPDAPGTNLGAVTSRLGYRFERNLAVEGEVSFGVKRGTNARLSSAIGLYGRGILPVTPDIDLFGRVGIHNIDVKGRGPAPVSYDKTSIAFGAGAEFRVSPRFGIRGDYTRLEGGPDTNTWGVAGVLNF